MVLNHTTLLQQTEVDTVLLLGINIIIKFAARAAVKSDQRVTTVVGLGGETD